MRYRVFDRIPSDWNVCAVEDVCEINPSQIGPDYPYSVIEYIDISSVSPRHLESVQVLPLKSAPSRAKRIVQDGDTIISTVRPNRRSFLYIKGAKPNTVVSTGFAVIRPRDIDSRYAHYVLTSDPFIEHLTANATGSAYPAVSPEIIAKTLIPLPPKDEQKRIGEILGALDDKIELNHRMNRTLEAIARAIFKSWFVDFEPFRDGEFVDSDLGPIPKSWEVVKIASLCSYIANGGTPSRNKKEYWNPPEVPWIKTTEIKDCILIGAEECISALGYQKSSAKLLPVDSVLVAMYGVTAGQIGLLKFKATTNQACCALVASKETSPYYLYQMLLHRQGYLKNLAIGSAQQNLNQKAIAEMKILQPPKKVINSYHGMIAPIYGQITTNLVESGILAQTRDAILPKLLSGEMRIKDPDKFIKEVV